MNESITISNVAREKCFHLPAQYQHVMEFKVQLAINQEVEKATRELQMQLAMALDAANKGEEGRKLGTAYEGACEELTQWKAVAESLFRLNHEHKLWCAAACVLNKFCDCGHDEALIAYNNLLASEMKGE